jgi:hypothetical protein
MDKESIIRMAREAGLHRSTHNLASNPVQHRYSYDGYEENLERFAAIVISHHVKETRPKPDATEREWLQQIAYQHGGIGDLSTCEFEFGAAVAAAERKRLREEIHSCHANCDHPVCVAVRKEREAISDEYSSRLQGDLENGVRWLNEAASKEFQEKYPELAGFLQWLNDRERGQA